jgi:hypothetical protein
MLEIIKTVGSIMGLLSFPFFLYDRYAKWRPVASLTVRLEGARKVPCIRVSNPTPYDLMVLGSATKPKVYYLTENTETREIIAGSMGRTPSFVLKAGESKELVICRMKKAKRKREKKKVGGIGSSFDDFLKEGGIYESVTARAIKRVLARQLDELMRREENS